MTDWDALQEAADAIQLSDAIERALEARREINHPDLVAARAAASDRRWGYRDTRRIDQQAIARADRGRR